MTYRYAFIALMLIVLVACDANEQLSEFSSDGCSLFPDNSVINNNDWCECCEEHDVAYWQGSTKEQRYQADLKLKQCVLEKTNDAVLANIMFEGVRLGGSPYFYNWYRWGYGWSYDRKYQELTKSEQVQAQKLLTYYRKQQSDTCH